MKVIKPNLHMFGGRGSDSGVHQGKGFSTKKSEKFPGDDNHVRKIDQNETYVLYTVRDGKEKLYDRDTGDTIGYELKGYKYDPDTGLWRDRYGREYRVQRANRR